MSAKRGADAVEAPSEAGASKRARAANAAGPPAGSGGSATSPFFRRLTASEPFFVFAGPCVIEGEEHALRMARELKAIGELVGCVVVYKSSFDKANRTSHSGHRGPGIEEGLRILAKVKAETGMPIITDVHEPWQCQVAADAGVDVLQIPAFLCRQTDLLVAAASTTPPCVVNVKKGQFASAQIAIKAGEKVARHNPNVMLCERGNTYGYGDLVVDPRNLVRMRKGGWPVVMDCTHAVQQPAAADGATKSGGLRHFVPVIARMAVAVGVDGFFFEVHHDPPNALCDGPNQWPLHKFEATLRELVAIARASNGRAATEEDAAC